MHIVVLMAGHSRRFAQAGYEKPKFLFPVGDKIMLGHVVDMFDEKDHFHFVINQDQVNRYPGIFETLRNTVRNVDITIIQPHELGPTYSAVQVESIPADQPVIITYCDFTVSWNYGLFLRHAEGHDGAIPVFKGFHPASYGNTYYAYVRTEGDRMLQLKEKQSFTDDRTSEYASVGIYYFGSWRIFRSYANKLLDAPSNFNKEAYVSLINNLLVEDGLDVVIHKVDQFICLGTPEDVEQYVFWHDRFRAQLKVTDAPRFSKGVKQVNVIPMAGKSSRFRQAGYRLAKPLISIQGIPMIIRAAKTFPAAKHWIFLPRGQDYSRHPIEATISEYFPPGTMTIIPVEKLTTGQAATGLLAEKSVNPYDPLFIASCDYEHFYDHDAWQKILNDEEIDGAIWTYRMKSSQIKNPNSFAYCRVGTDGLIVEEVVEKRTISDDPKSDPLVVGSFWYRRASDFFLGVRSMMDKGITVNGEHYVGTSINQLIDMGRNFVIFDVDQWVSFGDPFELNIFEFWESYFFAYSKPNIHEFR